MMMIMIKVHETDSLLFTCMSVLLCAGGVGSGPVSYVYVWLGGLSRAVYAGCTGAGQSGLCEAVD